MTEQTDNGFHYVCGKCGGNSLYLDEDRTVGATCIACRKCGNRYYGDAGMFASGAGVAPRKVVSSCAKIEQQEKEKVSETRESRKAMDATQGAGKQIEKEVVAMEKKTQGQEQAAQEKKKPVKRKPLPCGNCGRIQTVAAAGRCGTCYPVGRKYPEGSAEQAEALRTLKERLQQEGPKRGVKRAKAAVTRIKVQPDPKKEIPDRREGTGETEKRETAAGVGTLTLININNNEDKIEGDPKIFLGYQTRVRGDDGNRRKPWWIISRALYVLCSTERIIIDAARRGKLILVEK